MKNEELYKLRDEFVKVWSLDKVKNMTIQEYTNLNKEDSFCYQLEIKTHELGSIKGGTSFKFGIFEGKNTEAKNKGYDGQYAWEPKYGKTRDEVFAKIKNILISIIENSQKGDFQAIDKIDLGNATKWKIAYLYSDNKILNVFSRDMLKVIAQKMNLEFDEKVPFSQLQAMVLNKKPANEDFFDFGKRIWNLIGITPEQSNAQNYKNLLQYKKQIILQGPPGTGKTRLAKKIANEILGENFEKDQLKLIQFHPAYSYEDFVRGIVAKTSEKGISYEVENKILGEMAQKAIIHSNFENYLAFYFNKFIEFLKNIEFDINLNDDEIKSVKVSGDEIIVNAIKENYKYNYSINEILEHCHKRISKNYFNILGFKDVISEYFLEHFFPNNFQEKNFVLIIDEINRANLSAVLGELIYALEYRGEAVDSVYAINGDNSLMLPPNLYIIGTMNTADRSVGRLDYAIRRRFAFVDVFPKDLSEELNEKFAQNWFLKVSKLFDDYLSSDFKKEQVQLGHSYFITENTDIFMRWEYEIMPILLEYARDGVLFGENIEEIIKNLPNEIDPS